MYCKWNSNIVAIHYYIEFKKINTSWIFRRTNLLRDGYFEYPAMHY